MKKIILIILLVTAYANAESLIGYLNLGVKEADNFAYGSTGSNALAAVISSDAGKVPYSGAGQSLNMNGWGITAGTIQGSSLSTGSGPVSGGDFSVGGFLAFGGYTFYNVSTGTADNDNLVTKGYVDDADALKLISVTTDDTLTGSGTVASPLSVAVDPTSADATPYPIVAVNGTATVDRANGILQTLTGSSDVVLDVVAGSALYDSQVNLVVTNVAYVISYTANATNIVTGLSDITMTNTTTTIFYSPLGLTTWEASLLYGGE